MDHIFVGQRDSLRQIVDAIQEGIEVITQLVLINVLKGSGVSRLMVVFKGKFINVSMMQRILPAYRIVNERERAIGG